MGDWKDGEKMARTTKLNENTRKNRCEVEKTED